MILFKTLLYEFDINGLTTNPCLFTLNELDEIKLNRFELDDVLVNVDNKK